jgi:hypothetical protein
MQYHLAYAAFVEYPPGSINPKDLARASDRPHDRARRCIAASTARCFDATALPISRLPPSSGVWRADHPGAPERLTVEAGLALYRLIQLKVMELGVPSRS